MDSIVLFKPTIVCLLSEIDNIRILPAKMTIAWDDNGQPIPLSKFYKRLSNLLFAHVSPSDILLFLLSLHSQGSPRSFIATYYTFNFSSYTPSKHRRRSWLLQKRNPTAFAPAPVGRPPIVSSQNRPPPRLRRKSSLWRKLPNGIFLSSSAHSTLGLTLIVHVGQSHGPRFRKRRNQKPGLPSLLQ